MNKQETTQQHYFGQESGHVLNTTSEASNHTTTDSKFGGFSATSSSTKTRPKPSACVFVASLCKDKTDDQLHESVRTKFSPFGNITSTKVLRDSSNRPYAFVQYSSDMECKLAISLCHNTQLDGRRIRCEPAKVNRTLYMTFGSRYDPAQVTCQLNQFGAIEQLLCSNSKGKISHQNESKFWYVKFVYRDDAIKAFAHLSAKNGNKTGIKEKPVVEWAQNIESASFDPFSIYVGQLPAIEKPELIERFLNHGTIKKAELIKRQVPFAFITYAEEASAASAVEHENHATWNGKSLHVQYKEFHNKFEASSGLVLAPPPVNMMKKTNKNFYNEIPYYYVLPEAYNSLASTESFASLMESARDSNPGSLSTTESSSFAKY